MVRADGPTSYLANRYDGVVAQTDWYTCGPAAVATLLRYYFDVKVDETHILQLAAAVMHEMGQDATSGISALGLVRALDTYGVHTVGYRLTVDAVADYFRRGGLPVIVHVTKPQQHYVVAVGMAGEYVLIADPSWGRRIELWSKFARAKQFSGVVLVPIPAEHHISTVTARQRQSMERMVIRLGHLASAGRAVLQR